MFIEDEVEYLEEYGFLDLLPGQKYRTNIFIEDIPYDVLLRTREIESEIAKLVCDIYVPEILVYLESCDRDQFYIPNDDWNFFLWSMIPMMISQIESGEIDWDRLRKKNYRVKRKDGGDYVAVASVYREENYDEVVKHEICCGPMLRGGENVNTGSWSLSTDYADREFGWEDNLGSDYVFLYQFMKGELPKAEGTLDRYVRLYDRGLLVNEDGKDEVNVIVQKINVDIENHLLEIISKKSLPTSDVFRKKLYMLIQKRVEMEKQYFPQHMYEMLEIYRTVSSINKIKVIDELLERGILKPLTERQKKGVMVILYADLLPLKDEN